MTRPTSPPDPTVHVPPAGAPALPESAGRSGALELLRVGAVALLVLYHAELLAPGGDRASKVLGRLFGVGWVGTDVLLALAGFLAVDAFARAGGPLRWLARRGLRVYPALVLFLGVYLFAVPAALAPWLPAELQAGFAQARGAQGWLWTLTTNVLMMQGGKPGAYLEPLLTLSLGAQLTVFLALLLWRPRLLPWGLAALAVVGAVLRARWLHEDVWLSYSCPLTRGDAFAAGALLAWLREHPRLGPLLHARRGRLLAGAGALLVLAAAATHGLSVFSPAIGLVGYPAVGLFAGALVLVLAEARRRDVPGARFGAWAYPVYLVKLPVAGAVRGLLAAAGLVAGVRGLLLLAVLSGAASAVLGGLLHLAEKPLLQRLERLAWRRSAAPVSSPAP